jgi:hypothetical protein
VTAAEPLSVPAENRRCLLGSLLAQEHQRLEAAGRVLDGNPEHLEPVAMDPVDEAGGGAEEEEADDAKRGRQ